MCLASLKQSTVLKLIRDFWYFYLYSIRNKIKYICTCIYIHELNELCVLLGNTSYTVGKPPVSPFKLNHRCKEHEQQSGVCRLRPRKT